MTTRKQMEQQHREWLKRLRRNRAKWRRENMQEALRNVENIEKRISKLQAVIQDANGELPILAPNLARRGPFMPPKLRRRRKYDGLN